MATYHLFGSDGRTGGQTTEERAGAAVGAEVQEERLAGTSGRTVVEGKSVERRRPGDCEECLLGLGQPPATGFALDKHSRD